MSLSSHLHEHHRALNGGEARAAVFGVSDGLTSNLALVAGVAASGVGPSAVLAAGLAGMVAGAFSMASGEWVSMRAHSDLIHAELDKERRELARNPSGEHAELEQLLIDRGLRAEAAADVAAEMMVTPEVALVSHAREELGVEPDDHGSPMRAAAASFASFVTGAAVPLMPWALTGGPTGLWLSLALSMLCAIGVGCVLARLSHQRPGPAVARQVGALFAATALTSAIGSLVGVAV